MRLAAKLAVLSLCIAQASAQELGPLEQRRKEMREGTHVFRRILHDAGYTPLKGYADLPEKPGATLLVVLGDLEGLRFVPGGLQKFLSEGGAALIASDRKVRDAASRKVLLDVAGVTIDGVSLACLDERWCYEGLDFCPFLVPASTELFTGRDKGGASYYQVAANVPSMLVRRSNKGRPVAYLPQHCRTDPGGKLIAGNPLFGVMADVGKGRALILADHSVFINEMMIPRATNNVEMASAAIEALKGGQRRSRVLFVEEGLIQTKLDIPMKSLRIPLDEAVRILIYKRNVLADEAQRWVGRQALRGGFSERLWGWIEERVDPGLLLTLALIGVTLALLCYLLYRVGVLARFAHDPTANPLLRELDDLLPEGGLAQQRAEGMAALGDARSLVTEMAREWLSQQGLPVPEGYRSPQPEWSVGGSFWHRRQLLRRLGQAWRHAAGAYPCRVPPSWVEWWSSELRDLAQRRERGEWGVAPGWRRRADGGHAA
jgi:hypothetical protein